MNYKYGKWLQKEMILFPHQLNVDPEGVVKTMKSYITYHIWEKYSVYLSKCFWKERTFFSDGYWFKLKSVCKKVSFKCQSYSILGTRQTKYSRSCSVYDTENFRI